MPYIEVSVTKTAKKGGVEFSHVTGPNNLAMWVESEAIVKDLKSPSKTKDLKSPEETK